MAKVKRSKNTVAEPCFKYYFAKKRKKIIPRIEKQRIADKLSFINNQPPSSVENI